MLETVSIDTSSREEQKTFHVKKRKENVLIILSVFNVPIFVEKT